MYGVIRSVDGVGQIRHAAKPMSDARNGWQMVNGK
jgi:hypothetical protein